MQHCRFVSLLSGLLLVSTTHGADWPQWQGPNRDGMSKETGLLKKWPKGGPKLLWTYSETGTGYSSPAIVGDRLYIFGAEDPAKGDKEFVLCINVKDGKQIWKKTIEAAAGKFDLGDYSRGNGPRGSPVVDGKYVYFEGAKGDLACLETEDGKIVWQKHLVVDFGGKVPTWGFAESVLIDGDQLICSPGGKKGALAALKKTSGEVIWRSTDADDGAHYSSPVICNFGVKHYVKFTPNGLIGVKASDGKLLWRAKVANNGIAVCSTPIVDDRYIFASSGYNTGCGLVELSGSGDSITAKEVYNTKTLQNHHGGIIRLGDYVYGHSDKGGWMCLNFKKDGEEPVWKSGKLGKGSIFYADGHFYCYTEGSGTLAMIEANPKEYVEVNRMELPKKSSITPRKGSIWTHPVIANGKLYLRDHELLFCFDLNPIQ
jgi:outer membrane protein assembly factor BamB